MADKTDILFIHALTGLHPGSGTALGVVDLPVQRERHTQWPVIPGSAIKGVIRDSCRRGPKADEVVEVFGPEKITGTDEAFAGALSFTDARILAFPVRSLKGVFAWVTCPAVLERLKRDLEIGEFDTSALKWPTPAENQAAFGDALKVEQSVVLEEFDFRAQADADAKRMGLADWLATRVTADAPTGERIKTHLVILHDNDFTHFVRHATEVVARIGLDHEKKTVKTGALFYQEFLPPETIFYSLAMASTSRGAKRMQAGDVLGLVAARLAQLKVIQIGGDETIGKGLCAVKLMNGGK